MPVSDCDVAASPGGLSDDVERIRRGVVYHLEREGSRILVETDIAPALLIREVRFCPRFLCFFTSYLACLICF
jgi:hypothetical protein